MQRSRLLPLLAWVSVGLSACFGGTAAVDSADGEAPDANADATSPDATTPEASADAPVAVDATDASLATDAFPEADALEASGEAAEVDAEASTLQSESGSDASGEAEAGAGDATAEAAPPIDAGNGCIPPGPEAPLSAAAEGLPSSGMVMWLRADHGVYMTAANRVCAWADQSVNGALFTTAGGARPLFLSAGGPGGSDAGDGGGQDGGALGGIGGQPSVYFDAAGSFLWLGGVLGIPATSARTFIAVTRMVISGGRFHSIIMGDSASSQAFVMLDANTWQTAGNLEGMYVPGNSYDTALPTSTTSRVHVFTLATLAASTPVVGNVDYRINGAAQSFVLRAGSGSFTDFSTANFTAVGDVDTTNSVGQGGTAVLAEAIAYSRALDSTEKAAVESALMARYGIP